MWLGSVSKIAEKNSSRDLLLMYKKNISPNKLEKGIAIQKVLRLSRLKKKVCE